jgi:hypothetical protein
MYIVAIRWLYKRIKYRLKWWIKYKVKGSKRGRLKWCGGKYFRLILYPYKIDTLVITNNDLPTAISLVS